MLKEIEQMEALLRQLKAKVTALQNAVSGSTTEPKNIRGWMPCTVCDKKHRANHPHMKKGS
jgi:hypothetical protein